MSERKSRKPCEAQTTLPLAIAEPLETEDPVQKVLAMLYDAAMNGNVTAAKLYLEVIGKRTPDAPAELTLEEALKLLAECAPATPPPRGEAVSSSLTIQPE